MKTRRYFGIPLLSALLLGIPLWLHAAQKSEPATSATAREKKAQEIKTLPIVIEGVKHLDPDGLYNVLGVKTASWFEFWKEKEKRIPVELIPAIKDTLRGYLDSKGYYDADYRVEVSPKGVKIIIHENRPVTVEDINVSSDFPIRDYITFKKGEPFDTDTFISIKSRIKKALLKEGYCSYDLDTKAYVDLEKRTVDLLYRLKKGGLCHFGNTTVVSKPEDLRDAVILSRMRYRPGDIFTTERVNESYSALNKLGIFGQTLINTEIKYFNEVRPQVSAKYKEHMHRYTLSVGYDTTVGLRARGTYDHFNFFGGGRKVGLVAQYSSKDIVLTANFFQPAIFQLGDRYIDLYLDGGYTQHSYDTYDENRFYLNGWLNHNDGTWSYDLGLTLERINITLTGDDEGILPGNFNLLYGYGRIIYDRRDSKLNPRNGYYLSGYLEYGYSQGSDGNNPYYKMLLEAHLIKSFGDFTLATVGRLGVVDDGGVAALPASKYFYAGGSFSNRAYGDREIGITYAPADDGSLGGRTWLNFTAELQYPVWGDLYGGIFYDATMLSEDIYDFSFAWVQSAGIGLRYMTPVGPMKIDFAVNLHDLSTNRISIMIGQSF
ncbi:BamA/TamA family outer membrane protein [Nitratifractor sp.]